MVCYFLCTYAIYAKHPLPPNLKRTPASALNDGRVYDRRYEPGGGLAVRTKVSLAVIDKAVHHELSRRLGYDAKDHMMRVYQARIQWTQLGCDP